MFNYIMTDLAQQTGVREPFKAHPDDAAWDVHALISILHPVLMDHQKAEDGHFSRDDETFYIFPKCTVRIPTGLLLEFPVGWAAFFRDRSGKWTDDNLMVRGVSFYALDGTIDPGYRGEYMLAIYNFGHRVIGINHNERFAQLLFPMVYSGQLTRTDVLSETRRAASGFGSTGK